jgi:hypothetical protein
MPRLSPSSPLARSAARRAVLLSLIVALAACGKSEAAGATRAAGNAEGGDQGAGRKARGFALEDMKSEMHDGQLAIALTFTQKSRRRAGFDTLLRVTGPKGEAVHRQLGARRERQDIALPYVEADKNYTVALEPGSPPPTARRSARRSTRKSIPARCNRLPGLLRRAACCRRAARAACPW